MPCDLPTDCALVIFSLSELADVAQLLLVDDFDAPSVHGDDALLCECREGADGITGGHVRQVGEIFACEVNLQRLAILLKPVVVKQCDERLGESASDVFLSKGDDFAVAAITLLSFY